MAVSYFYKRQIIKRVPVITAGTSLENGTSTDRIKWLEEYVQGQSEFPDNLTPKTDRTNLLRTHANDVQPINNDSPALECLAVKAIDALLTKDMFDNSIAAILHQIKRNQEKFDKIIVIYPSYLKEGRQCSNFLFPGFKKIFRKSKS